MVCFCCLADFSTAPPSCRGEGLLHAFLTLWAQSIAPRQVLPYCYVILCQLDQSATQHFQASSLLFEAFFQTWTRKEEEDVYANYRVLNHFTVYYDAQKLCCSNLGWAQKCAILAANYQTERV